MNIQYVKYDYKTEEQVIASGKFIGLVDEQTHPAHLKNTKALIINSENKFEHINTGNLVKFIESTVDTSVHQMD